MQMSFGKARVWEETVTIPTYGVGAPNKNPMFLEKRVYQGSSGKVYPHPVTDKIFDEKADRAYRALFLENAFIRVMLLPEIGGRIQRAYDKIGEQDFVYYNHVIKPALVGLAGPWISGGIEFNWPQHHRPSTFDPVDYTYFENADGSASAGLSVPQSAVYYNDQPPESIFCQGLALRRLGEEEQARSRFRSLADFADAHENDEVQIDYFAVSLPDFLVFDADLNVQNRAHCLFMRGLGLLGMGQREKAMQSFSAARALDNSHAGLTLYTDLFTKGDFV